MQPARRRKDEVKSKKADTQEVVFALHCTLRRKDGEKPRFVMIGLVLRKGRDGCLRSGCGISAELLYRQHSKQSQLRERAGMKHVVKAGVIQNFRQRPP